MGKIWRRRIMWGLAGFFVLAAVIYGFWPQPIAADLAKLEYRPFQVTVDDEGVARIRDFYVVSAPVAGTVTRSALEVGDFVKEGETVIAQIRPSAPSLLDMRDRRSGEAAVEVAQAGLALAEANLARARAEAQFAQGELERTERLAQRGVTPERTLDQARTDARMKQAAIASAEAQIAINNREVERARANLIDPTNETASSESCCVTVKSPVSGNVIKVVTKSEVVVSPGASLVELGNPRDLEIVVELLSADAVRVKEGDQAIIEEWGGKPLRARVRRIEPTAFQKVSALGIEEQRVLVRLDLVSAPEEWQRLGHDYRVFVRIVVWETDRALTVPLSALFRQGESWAVFTVTEEGAAKLRPIKLGERNLRYAIVEEGVNEGERVILHPNDQIRDEVRIVERSQLEQ